MTADKREEINARRRAVEQNKSLDERNIRRRARRQNKSREEQQEENARRRRSRQSKTSEERVALLAQRRATAEARRNTPCAESIAMPCPNAASFPTIKMSASTHKLPATKGNTSAPASPSTSTPAYTIGTEGNIPIFTTFLYYIYHLHLGALKHHTYRIHNVVGDMETFLRGLMDEDASSVDLMDEECYTREGRSAVVQPSLIYELI
jgi:hypothetical protein